MDARLIVAACWSRPEQMAFLINYPDIRSIWDFGKVFGNPFKDQLFLLLEKKTGLDAIEHELLRPVYRDPRVHYAVNCASIGCPEQLALHFLDYDWSLNDFRSSSRP